MALTITLTPNIGTYILGDPPVVVSLTGGNSATGGDILWESNGGVFSNPYENNTQFTPDNATAVVTVVGRRVWHNPTASVVNVGSTNSYGGIVKVSGDTNSWDAHAIFANPLLTGAGFIQAIATEINTEKAVGFLSNSTYKDPNIVNSDPNLTFAACWHLMANGTALPRKQGVSLSNPVVYKASDKFRVTRQTGKVIYSVNDRVYATATEPDLSGWYATSSYKTTGGGFTAHDYFYDYENSGTKTISVTGLFPVQPNYSFELNSDNNTLVSVAEDGSATFRKKGNLKRTLALQFNERTYAEWLAINNFWKAHEKHQFFMYRDLVFDETYIMRFESGPRTSVLGPNNVTITATLKEV